MQLGINGWRIHGQRTGVGRYLYNVVRHWDADSLRGHGFDVARLYTPAPFTELPAGHALDMRVRPLILLWRFHSAALRRPAYISEFGALLPLLSVFALVWAIGEMAGYALGPGEALRKLE